ncbi:MAG TPA: hypothetical protein VKV20_19715 [Ktedonobacteraceae bacterium]|nr:hypothetical protein [Ktedonobacteraceae bacterium]
MCQLKRHLLLDTFASRESDGIEEQRYIVKSYPQQATAYDSCEKRVGGAMEEREVQREEAKGSASEYPKPEFDQNKPGAVKGDVQGRQFPHIDHPFARQHILSQLYSIVS